VAHEPVSFTEVVDSRAGVIRARGHLTAQAADLLSGAVLALHEGGHRRVLLDLQGLQGAEAAGLSMLQHLQTVVTAEGGAPRRPAPTRGHRVVNPPCWMARGPPGRRHLIARRRRGDRKVEPSSLVVLAELKKLVTDESVTATELRAATATATRESNEARIACKSTESDPTS
jgi:hypothetical protein